MNDVTVIFVTWNRKLELMETVDAFLRNCIYDHSKLHLHIADDQSPTSYIHDVMDEFSEYDWSYTVTPRMGWGANVNAAFNTVAGDYIFLNEDDYVAGSPFNLEDGVALLENVDDLGCVRYNHLTGHLGIQLRVEELKLHDAKYIHYLRILKKESTFAYIYSNRPHLQHRRFWETYGPYPEGARLGQTEESRTTMIKNMTGPDICILYNGTIDYKHIGVTHQLSEHDVST